MAPSLLWGPQGWVVTLSQSCTSIRCLLGTTFLNPCPLWGSRSALHSLASFSDARPFRWQGELPKSRKSTLSLRTRDSRPGSGWEICSGPRGAPRPLVLPEGCCGAEITGEGRVGWRILPGAGLYVNNEWLPSQARR